MAGRVTQLVVEAVIAATDANVRVTQVAVEAVIAPTDAVVRTTQIVVEVVVSPTSQNIVVSQSGIEVAGKSIDPNLVVSQAGLEVALTADSRLLVSQAGIEVAWEIPKGFWSLDARLVYNDNYPDRRSNWTTFNAIVKALPTGSFAANAVIKKAIFFRGPQTIAVDALSYNSGTTLVGSWTHTPVGTPRAVVATISHANWDHRVTGVTYGGVALSEVHTEFIDSGKQNRSYIYFLGSNVPAGPQTVVVSGTNDSGRVTIATLTAAENLAVLDHDGSKGGAGTGTKSYLLDYDEQLGMAFVAAGTGYSSSAIANETQLVLATHSNGWDSHARQATAGTSDFTAGVALSQSSDWAISVAAFGVVGRAYPSTLTLDAVLVQSFTIDAQIGYWFPVSAEIVPRRFMADAVVKRTLTGSYTVNATRLWTVSKTNVTAKAVIRWTVVKVPGFTADAVIMPRFRVEAFIQPYFWTDAITRWTVSAGFTADALITPYFTVGAFIQPYFWANARLELGFLVNAVLKKTMGVPAFQPLVYPGTRQTLYNNVANALTPLVSIGEGELLTVRVVTPPSDGGDLGAFNTTRTLNYGITASPGEYVLNVLPGQYYIYSSKNNVYRPGLTGSGSYSSWDASTLTIKLDAFIQCWFPVDASIVWTWHSDGDPGDFPPLTADAWIKRIWIKTFTAEAFIPFTVRAWIAPMHFTASAWIKTVFTVDAWIIRRVTDKFTLDAFRQPSFRVNAVKRKTQSKTMAVASWISNPVYGIFHVQALVGYYFTASASIRLIKYRRFTAAAVLKAKITSLSTVDAFVEPWFTLDAWIFRQEFFTSAVILREQAGSKTVDAWSVILREKQTTADAYIPPWFTVNAIRFEILEKTLAVSSWLVVRRFASTTLDAVTVGAIRTNAVILHLRMGGVFTFYAWKGAIPNQRTFSVNAEKSDAGAYWDPEYEVWRYPHFTLDAQIVIPRLRSMNVDAALAVDGLVLRSFYANARIYGPQVTKGFWIEATIDAQKTIVYEGEGRTEQALTTVTERFTLPGWSDVIGGGENRTTSLFRVAPNTPVVMTVWDWGTTLSTGLIANGENLWGNTTGGHSAFGEVSNITDGGTTTITVWPTYTSVDHHVYSWNGSNAYDPVRTEEGMVSYQRLDTITLARPAPTIDAWIVGTKGIPWTIDAEIVGREKTRSFTADADISRVGEQRGQFGIGAHVLAITSMWWRMDATFIDHGFSVDALIYHPSMLVDAFIAPYFCIDAVIGKTVIPRGTNGKGPLVDAVIVRPTRVSSFTAGADISRGEPRGIVRLDATVVGQRGWRIYLAAQIAGHDMGMAVDAYIGQHFTAGAWIQPRFTVDAHIRGEAQYIIFPEDGSPPVDAHGNPAGPRVSLNVKIEAFIPDEIPVGNDDEIERLIMLILEAEAELESLYCAVKNYGSQGYPVAGGSNSSGGGYTGSLPPAVAQTSLVGGGDIDDCWVAADIWAAFASGQSFKPSVPQYRGWAGNPDRPGSTGGSLSHSMRAARKAWPGATVRRYSSSNWDGFTSLLKAGWSASLSVRLRGLPSSWGYGPNDGMHRIGVVYQNGSYYYMDPNQHNGSAPRAITGLELRTAARAHSGGVIGACMFR